MFDSAGDSLGSESNNCSLHHQLLLLVVLLLRLLLFVVVVVEGHCCTRCALNGTRRYPIVHVCPTQSCVSFVNITLRNVYIEKCVLLFKRRRNTNLSLGHALACSDHHLSVTRSCISYPPVIRSHSSTSHSLRSVQAQTHHHHHRLQLTLVGVSAVRV